MEQQEDASAALADTVFGVFERDRLSDALVALHRGGFGPNLRVIDGARGDLVGQIRRAALQDAIDAASLDADHAIVVVSAPGRAAVVADTLLRNGARRVQALTRRAAARTIATPGAAPDIAPEFVTPRDEARS